MKSIVLHMVWITIAIINLSSCKDDALVENGSLNIEEGVPVNLTLGYNTKHQTIKSRVTQTVETEYHVNSIYLFVFNNDGTIDYQGEPTITGGSYDEAKGTTEGIIQIPEGEVSSGYRKRIYALANIDTEGNNEGDMQTINLEGIENENDLLNLTANLNNSLQINRFSFLMTGSLTKDKNNREVQEIDIDTKGYIYPAGNPNPIVKPTIYLHRIDAKITFQIKIGDIQDDEADNGSIKNVEFIPRNFEVHNLPSKSCLFPNGTIVLDPENDYASMDENSYETFDSETQDNIHFNFYMFENECNVNETDGKHYITEEKNTDKLKYLYFLREKEIKDENGENQQPAQYVYAPNNATYVIIRGDLSYERTNQGMNQYINEAVRYTVHLGETGYTEEDYNNPLKVNNYTVTRNTHYTYTVTIQGVQSIKVEVKDDKELQPGHEGDVIVAGNQVNQIDCHYGRALFKLSRAALMDEERGGLSWTIQTPFDQGIKLAKDEKNTLKDYKWVLFAINAEFGIDMTNGGIYSPIDGNWVNMVKFPGYSAYDGGAFTISNTSSNTNEDTGDSPNNVLGYNNISGNNRQNQPWKEHIPNGNFYEDYVSPSYGGSNLYVHDGACLRDVNQLLNYLRKKAKETDGGGLFVKEGNEEYVYVTAFIDEYVYRYDPRNEEYIAPNTAFGRGDKENSRKLLWKQTTNSEPRMMHICVDVPQISQDGSSSWTESVVSFIQKPIYSIYNEQASDDDLKSAWGTESIIEGEALEATPQLTNNTYFQNYVTSFNYGGDYYRFSDDNGRVNTLMFFMNCGEYDNSLGSYVKKWSNILNRTDNTLNGNNGAELKKYYRDIWHACLIRNRDLDGDNIIEPGEVRWFLASIDELTDLWIGEDAMPDAARLYQEDGTVRAHVASSSGEPTNPWVIWAEEGASRGPWDQSCKSKGNGSSAENPKAYSTKYYYRCIRYLGISMDDIGLIPDDYVEVRNGNIYVTNLSRLAKRDAADNGLELPRHNERGSDDVNKPYSVGFKYILQPTGNADILRHWGTQNNIKGFEEMLKPNNRSELCPPGYRVPNQRELMLMMTSIPDWTNGDFWSSTRFSFNGTALYKNNKNEPNRPCFATDDANLILTRWPDSGSDNIPARVRCVRDIYR